MRSVIAKILVNGLALWVAGWILPGLNISSAKAGEAVASAGLPEWTDILGVIVAYLFIAVIFAVVNALARPLVGLLALPITILTLGLFTIVINAGMLYLTSWISSYTPVHLTIDSFFWTAVLAALLITLISLLASPITKGRR